MSFVATTITISTLLDTILGVLDDSSSVAVRLALSALQLCIHDLLLSVNSDIGLQALLKLLEIRENPYWLVKVLVTLIESYVTLHGSELIIDISDRVACYENLDRHI